MVPRRMQVLERGLGGPRMQGDDDALARRAVAGDHGAFSALYERYEPRVWSLCYRITASADDAADATQDAFVKLLEKLPGRDEPVRNFAAYVLTVARNACYDLLERRKRADPVEEIPEPSAAQSAVDPVPPEDDPARAVLLESARDEVSAANERLEPRHREVLALREAEELSYDEIADVMGMNRNSVAQLILRARTALRRELLRGASVAIAPVGPSCERALPLICARQDEQRVSADDAGWLDAHLSDCDRCRLSAEELEETGRSYRAWAPLPVLLGLKELTAGAVADAFGFGWNVTAASGHAGGAAGSMKSGGGTLAAHKGVAVVASIVAVAAGGAAIVAATGGDDSEPAPPPPARAAAAPAQPGVDRTEELREKRAAERRKRAREKRRARARRRARERRREERRFATAPPSDSAPGAPQPARGGPAPSAPRSGAGQAPSRTPAPAPAPAPEPEVTPELEVTP